MATCGSLQHIFDNPLYTPQALSSCICITPTNLLDEPPVDVFSRFNLDRKNDSSMYSLNDHEHDHSGGSSQALIGSESFDDLKDFNDQWEERREHVTKHTKKKIPGESKRSRVNRREFPPPISSLGRRFCFKSYRFNGRLVLKEERMLTQEILHAYREDGRLKMRFIRFEDGVEAKPDHQRRKIR
ncbi:hypothetical protein QVD17_14902 [Tagetes erecta]|uniref:FAF domain-containing protein n=1 Tax=Tagetes erecta TaxID=13708 RepID=A0AAD8KRB8_TARER|nr:hypothetical protein QVD17_14902 [Tagetes erecta]